MDYLDIIIYIVFAAIGIFSSLGTQKRKKQTVNKQSQAPQARGNDTHHVPVEVMPDQDDMYEVEESTAKEVVTLDDIFRALREGRPLESIHREEVITEPTPEEEIEQPAVVAYEEGISVTRNKDVVQDEISDEGIYNPDDNDMAFAIENIDWRQAVITNEILNKKY